MKPIQLAVQTKSHSYPIVIGSNLISRISIILKQNSINFKKCLLVVDKNIPKKLYLKLRIPLIRKVLMFLISKLAKKTKIK
jgi:3-dehydroquinate synthetase